MFDQQQRFDVAFRLCILNGAATSVVDVRDVDICQPDQKPNDSLNRRKVIYYFHKRTILAFTSWLNRTATCNGVSPKLPCHIRFSIRRYQNQFEAESECQTYLLGAIVDDIVDDNTGALDDDDADNDDANA